jgi:hypothetical protein
MSHPLSHYKNRVKNSQAYFAIFELPALLFITIIGFIIEYLIELPFMLICILDHHFVRKKRPMNRDDYTVLTVGRRGSRR